MPEAPALTPCDRVTVFEAELTFVMKAPDGMPAPMMAWPMATPATLDRTILLPVVFASVRVTVAPETAEPPIIL